MCQGVFLCYRLEETPLQNAFGGIKEGGTAAMREWKSKKPARKQAS
jgi:hypothetical protein